MHAILLGAEFFHQLPCESSFASWVDGQIICNSRSLPWHRTTTNHWSPVWSQVSSRVDATNSFPSLWCFPSEALGDAGRNMVCHRMPRASMLRLWLRWEKRALGLKLQVCHTTSNSSCELVLLLLLLLVVVVYRRVVVVLVVVQFGSFQCCPSCHVPSLEASA